MPDWESIPALLAEDPESSASLDPAGRRARMDSHLQPVPVGTTVEPVDAGGVTGEWITHQRAIPGRATLFLHGGGYQAGSARGHRRLAALVAASWSASCLSIDYRLAPEHPCPAAIEDTIRAYRWLLARGIPAATIAVVGVTAGGGLATAALVELRGRGDPSPGAVVLLAPWVDLELTGDSVRRGRDRDADIGDRHLRAAASAYAGGRTLADPLVSPLRADLTGLPPMLAQVGEADWLLDDAVRLVERARLAGVDATLDVWPDMPHAFQRLAGHLPDADAAIDEVGDWLRAVTAPTN